MGQDKYMSQPITNKSELINSARGGIRTHTGIIFYF